MDVIQLDFCFGFWIFLFSSCGWAKVSFGVCFLREEWMRKEEKKNCFTYSDFMRMWNFWVICSGDFIGSCWFFGFVIFWVWLIFWVCDFLVWDWMWGLGRERERERERGMRFGSHTKLHISLIFWECDFLIFVFFLPNQILYSSSNQFHKRKIFLVLFYFSIFFEFFNKKIFD